MSESNSAQEKTEQPSQQKLKKSREDGQAARSKDLSTMISLLITLFVLKLTAGLFFHTLEASFRFSYLDLRGQPLATEQLLPMMGENILLIGKLMLPLLITPLLVVALSTLSGGWVFAAKNFYPKASKLNPISGLGRMFGAQNWTELLKSLLKIFVLMLVAWLQVSVALPELMQLQRTNVSTAIAAALDLTFDVTLSLLLIFVLFSLIDIPLQKFFFLKKLRMTKQELKEEHKNSEGRPEVKARIRQLQRQMLQRQISKVIKTADVIITNPTHYAVALRYDLKKAEAPFVVAKGVDDIALYIRELAQKNDLEVIELPPLARAVYFTTQVNQQIPVPLYTAVAQVLTYIVQLKAYRKGLRKKPRLADNIHIPESLANRA